MLYTKNKPLNILFCHTCNGTGYVKFRRCPECKGMSLGTMDRNQFFYWGEPLTKYHIAVRKARRYLNYFRIGSGFLGWLGLSGYFVWVLYQSNNFKNLFLLNFWQNSNLLLLSFWCSLIFLAYIFYRLVIDGKEQETVEFRDYKLDRLADNQTDEIPQTWLQVIKMSKSKKKNIAGVFSSEARTILEEAYWIALKNKSETVDATHIFYALLASVKVANIFIRLGISVKSLQEHVSRMFVSSTGSVLPIISDDVQQILFHSYNIAFEKRQEFVNVTEILLATVKQSEIIQEILYDLKVDKDKLNNVIEWLHIRDKMRRQYRVFQKAAAKRSKHGLDRAMTAVATPYLNSFSEDLTMAAKFGYLEQCVARETEIEEIFRIIDGGQQSVVLVGERGVGKMSIIEGIAQRMIEDNVPDKLKDKRLVQLSTSALLAGTTISGAQERLIKIMNEISRAKNIILFIKNIHDLVSITDSGGEGVDVSETLAEYLGPGRFLTFATTTTNDYNRTIINSELSSVISKVEIKEMIENQAIQVLESKVGVLEYKHKVFFSYDAIAMCVKLSAKFLHDQQLPKSAIGIMSEVASFTRENKGTNQMVTAEDVGRIVSQKTGVPTTNITEDETDKLMRLEKVMHERIVGQDEAVNLVANALRRARVEIRSQKKPIASFLFLGPTGVGKTELAKTIADIYFGGEKNMVRLDMSEYQDKASLYRLVGEIGKQGTGILTEAVRQKPFSLVLLDELEKADPDILTLFLQVLDDGRLTDSTGRLIDFTNTIIIATSNAGTMFVQEQIIQGIALESIRQQLIKSELKKYYRPEFLNRFDGLVLFRPLNKLELKQIAGLMLKRVINDLEKRGIELKVETTALDYLAEVGFDPEYGARPMNRAIQEHVENKLAEMILQGELKRRDVVVLGVGGNLRVETRG